MRNDQHTKTTVEARYDIIRVYLLARRRRVTRRNLTLDQARRHIASPKAVGRSPSYVDGYRAA